MKCDGEKGNPSHVEGVGSISTDVARRADASSAQGRRCACASATAGWLAPRHHRIAASCRSAPRASFLVQEPYGRGENRAQWRRNATMQSLFHVDVPPGRTALFDAGERTMVLHRAGLDLLQHLEGRNAAQLPYHV